MMRRRLCTFSAFQLMSLGRVFRLGKEPFGPPSLRYYAIMFVKLSSNQATEEKYCLSWQVWWRFTSCECCLRKRQQQIGRPQASRGNMIWTIFVDSRQGDNCCKLFLFLLNILILILFLFSFLQEGQMLFALQQGFLKALVMVEGKRFQGLSLRCRKRLSSTSDLNDRAERDWAWGGEYETWGKVLHASFGHGEDWRAPTFKGFSRCQIPCCCEGFCKA